MIETITEDAIVEPFLHFVLVLDWPKGRLLKEYTVLLDLPLDSGCYPAAPTPGWIRDQVLKSGRAS